ncbi:unnamed protein product [Lota lota]
MKTNTYSGSAIVDLDERNEAAPSHENDDTTKLRAHPHDDVAPWWGTLDLNMSTVKSRRSLHLLLVLLLVVQPSREQDVHVGQTADPNGRLPVGYIVEIQVNTSDVESLRRLQNTVMLPVNVSELANITSISTTTVCYSQPNERLQCQCEDQYQWSCDQCETNGACSSNVTDPCGCINGFPFDGQFCQPITSLSPCPKTTTPSATTSTPSNTTSTPSNTTSTPSNTTSTPSNTTSTPSNTTSTPSNTTSTPSNTTSTPSNTTSTPSNTTSTPSNTTSTPSNTTSTPSNTTSTPSNTTSTPSNTTSTPSNTTSTPSNTTSTPPNTTSTPPNTTSTPSKTTSTPSNTTSTPSNTTSTPSNTTSTPPNTTSTPSKTTSTPSNTTSTPSKTTSTPSNTTSSPSNTTSTPSNTTSTPSNTTSTPSKTTSTPSNTTSTPSNTTSTPPNTTSTPSKTTSTPSNTTSTPSKTTSTPSNTTSTPPNTTSTPSNTTSTPPNTTSTPSNTTSTPSKTTSTPSKTTSTPSKVETRQLSLTMAIEFQQTYKDPGSELFKDVNRSIQINGKNTIPNFLSANLDAIRQGSVIVDYTVRYLGAIEPKVIQNLTDGIFSELGQKYKLVTTPFSCKNDTFGDGNEGDKAITGCKLDEVGTRTAFCLAKGTWEIQQDNCVLTVLDTLLSQAQNLDSVTLPLFLDTLNNATRDNTGRVVDSPANIHTIVSILTFVANVSRSTPINETLMKDILETVDVVVSNASSGAWKTLNTNFTAGNSSQRDSSALLASIETISEALTGGSNFSILTRQIILNRSTLSGPFSANLNSVVLNLPGPHQDNSFITTINFNSLNNVLLPTNASNVTTLTINGNVVLVKSNSTVSNVTFIFNKLNVNLESPQCVFWNFSLLNNLGAWDSTGCFLVISDEQTVTCNCNHLTSFSILMSPLTPDSPILDFITYIGVGISMVSLVICLIVEAIVWRKINRNSTSYLRHVCIVNIAVSLLIANIWFIIGAGISDEKSVNRPACFAATFFIHFFYLSLFFWMLTSALLLLYRTVRVFGGGMSDGGLLVVGFSVGYGAPLIIAVVTIAATATRMEYFREKGVCWLNWGESKALLAFVIPALSIVLINLGILVVVLYKMLRSHSMGNSDRNTLLIVVRSLAVLTPFFGTTWGLGVGVMTNPEILGIHVAFAVLNSLQGFFILVFGTLLDAKVRSALKEYSSSVTTGTQNTSAGQSSSSGLAFLRHWGRRRNDVAPWWGTLDLNMSTVKSRRSLHLLLVLLLVVQPSREQDVHVGQTADPNGCLPVGYIVEIQVNTSDVESLRRLQNTVMLPVNELANITLISTTTVCYSQPNEIRQCQCEDQYQWSCDQCETKGACSSNIKDPCGCINGFPSDGQFCQPITSDSTCCVPVETRKLSFTMAIEFQQTYKDPGSELFAEVNRSIQINGRNTIPNFLSANLDAIRQGSVIVDYTVRYLGAIEPKVIQNLTDGIFSDLGQKYKLLTTPALTFTPTDVFAGDSVTVNCGNPNLTIVSAGDFTWTVNDNALTDRQKPFIKDGDAILTVSSLSSTDTGFYRCQHKDGSKRTGILGFVKPIPQLTVHPIQKTVACKAGQNSVAELECCVQAPYRLISDNIECKRYNYSTPCSNKSVEFICQERNHTRFNRKLTLTFSTGTFSCKNDTFGDGNVGDKAITGCKLDEVGTRTAFCHSKGTWEIQQDNCVLTVLDILLSQAQNLDSVTLPLFLETLNNATRDNTSRVVESPANIHTIVSILTFVANVSRSTAINETLMRDILETVDVVVSNASRGAWKTLNTNFTAGNSSQRDSSALLASIETISEALTGGSNFSILTRHIILNRSTLSGPFSANLNSVVLNLPGPHQDNSFITTINFNSLNNVLLPTNASNVTTLTINGNVVLVKSNSTVSNVTFIFDKLNVNLESPQCVFWNFSLLNNLGAWDSTGCTLVISDNQTVTCNCNHLTSFSILMSPLTPDSPILDFITYIGVGISMVSLVICLIVEAIVWRKINRNSTSYLRHVCIVNIAVSLLIANIWFIIGATISDEKLENPPVCFATTFFIHFFYLSLFFWMLTSALLLLYRTVRVFGGGMSDGGLLVVGFSVGYGAPLIIAVVTIAATATRMKYFREKGVCWLNWGESKALLAFVIPALSIVLINLGILVVVLYKMLRSHSMGNSDRNTLLIIVRSLAVLTPFFGTTWGLGVGVMTNPKICGIHVAFAVLNSLQNTSLANRLPVDWRSVVTGAGDERQAALHVRVVAGFGVVLLPNVFVAEILVESNITLTTPTLVSTFNNTNLAVTMDTGITHLLSIQHMELVADCTVLGTTMTCSCGPGYIWTNDVCYNTTCCTATNCTQPLSKYNPMCIPMVQVQIVGTVDLNLVLWDFTAEAKLLAGLRKLNGFESLNLTTLTSNYMAEFVANVSAAVSTTKLQEIIDFLELDMMATISMETIGLVNMSATGSLVCYESTPILTCVFNKVLSETMWSLKQWGGDFAQLGNGSIAELTDCGTPTCIRLTLNGVTGNWAGVYKCESSEGSVKHTALLGLSVALLPDPIEMVMTPLTVDCSEGGVASLPVTVTTIIAPTIEKYIVTWSYRDGASLPPDTSLQPEKSFRYTFTVSISCTFSPLAHYVAINFKNQKSQEKSLRLDIAVVYPGAPFCEEELVDLVLWPRTPAGNTVFNRTCPAGRAGYTSRTCEGRSWQDPFFQCASDDLLKALNIANSFKQGFDATQSAAESIFGSLNNGSTRNSGSMEDMADLSASISILNTMAEASGNILLGDSLFPNLISAASNMLNQSWDAVNMSVQNSMSTNYLESVEGLVGNIQANTSKGEDQDYVQLTICDTVEEEDCGQNVFGVEVDLNNTNGIIKTMAIKNLTEKLPIKNKQSKIASLVVSATLQNSSSRTIDIRLNFSREHLDYNKVTCVFWNVTSHQWSGDGCKLTSADGNDSICSCTHLTSFSALMSKTTLILPFLDELTYLGLGVSICALLLFLIIEALVWSAVVKSNLSHFRHTSLVNIAVSLLLADLSFLASAFPDKISETMCLVFTICKHFFFLTMFCWMLCLSVMLVHQLIFVFNPLRKRVFMFLSSIVGYIVPMLIVGITYVYYRYTGGAYLKKETCWLTYQGLLRGSIYAFLLPVGIVVLTNLFSMCVVIVTLTKTAVPDANKSDADTAKSILKVMLFLTPAFGITWILGFFQLLLGESSSEASIDGLSQSGLVIFITYAFTILNSFQGLFIFVSGVLAEQRVRDEVLKLILAKTSSGEKSEKNTTNTSKN